MLLGVDRLGGTTFNTANHLFEFIIAKYVAICITNRSIGAKANCCGCSACSRRAAGAKNRAIIR